MRHVGSLLALALSLAVASEVSAQAALAATSVLYEGVPQYPDAGRPWRIAERLDLHYGLPI